MESIVRRNLMNEKGYTPYCGTTATGCLNPRTEFKGDQFVCPVCGWTSQFPDDFIKQYKLRWNLSTEKSEHGHS